MSESDANAHRRKVKTVPRFSVRKGDDGPRCQYIERDDMPYEFNCNDEDTLYTNERRPHVSGGNRFDDETTIFTDKAYVYQITGGAN
jgi:hypothetical protein